MRQPIALALVVALQAMACTREQPLATRRVHPAATPVKSSDVSRAAVPPGDPHAVDRASTPTDYCVACHVTYDDPGTHPVRVSQAAAAAADPASYLFPAGNLAVVLRDGEYVECTSCHDDGSAGFAARTVLDSMTLCLSCHDMGFGDAPPTAEVTSPAPGSTVRGTVTVVATATDDIGVLRGELWAGTAPGAPDTLVATAQPSGGELAFALDTTALPNGTLYLTVRAYDVRNASAWAEVQVTVANEALPPAVSISSPAEGTRARGTIPVLGSAPGAVRAELWAGPTADTVTLASSSVPAEDGSFALALDTTALAAGGATLLVRACDAAGLCGTATASIVVDNVPPAIVITSPAAGAIVSGVIGVVASVADAAYAEVRVGPTADAPGAVAGTASIDVQGIATYSLDTSGIPDGTEFVFVRALDALGNEATAAVQVVVANAVPDVAISSPPAGARVRGALSIVAAAPGATRGELWAGAALLASADGDAYAFSLDTTAFADGALALAVRAYGPGGRAGEATATIVVDNTAPAVGIAAPPGGTTIRGPIAISASAYDANGVESVAFHVDGALLATRTAAPWSVTWSPVRKSGAHVLTATATDAAGNAAASAAVTVQVK